MEPAGSISEEQRLPKLADLIPSPRAISKKLLSLLTLLLLLYWCLFTLDIGRLFLEPIQTNWKKIARMLVVQDMGQGYFLRIVSVIKVPILYQFFLESNNENDNFFTHG